LKICQLANWIITVVRDKSVIIIKRKRLQFSPQPLEYYF